MRYRLPLAATELLLAIGCLIGAGVCWAAGVRSVTFRPDAGLPGFTSHSYSGGWIVGATALAIVAAVFLIDGVRRLRAPGPIPSGGIVGS